MSSDTTNENEFSVYGVYTISDSLDLLFPNNQIKFERIGEQAFSYQRNSADGVLIEKMIPAKSNQIKVEVYLTHMNWILKNRTLQN